MIITSMESETSFNISVDINDPEGDETNTVSGNQLTNMGSETSVSTLLESDDEGYGLTDGLVEDPLKKFRIKPKKINKRDEYSEELFKMLMAGKEDEFIEFLNNVDVHKHNSPDLNCNEGDYTYLQYACRNGLEKVARYLIDSGADLCAVKYGSPPLFMAIKNEYFGIAEYILEKDSRQLYLYSNFNNILHYVSASRVEYSDVGLHFLNYVLEKITSLYESGGMKEARYLLDDKDKFGNTPLNTAAENGFYKIVIALLENGVDMFRKNKRGDCGFLDLDPKVLEDYLNRKILPDISYSNFIAKQNIIKFNYMSIVPPECFEYDNLSEETSRIVYLSELPDFRHLIMHPVVSNLIHLKWQKVKWLFYLNVLVYSIFCFLFTRHILLHNESQAGYSKILVSICLFILSVRESMQVYMSPLVYVYQLENWMEISLLVTTILTMFSNTSVHRQVSAVAIFLTWTELLLLLGRYPNLSAQVEMYKRVSLNFFKFLSCYFIFVVAFALSFYTLSRDSNPDNAPLTQILSNVIITIYDTLVRFVELEPENLPLGDHPVIGHVFLIMFLLLIVIIMLNLLNGLAVSDTQAIIDEAKLFGHISRLKFIQSIEKIAKVFGREFVSRTKVFYHPNNYEKNGSLFRSSDGNIKLVCDIVAECVEEYVKNKGDLIVAVNDMVPSTVKKARQIMRCRVREPIENNVKTLLSRVDNMNKSADKQLLRLDNKVDAVSGAVKAMLDRIVNIEQLMTTRDIPNNN